MRHSLLLAQIIFLTVAFHASANARSTDLDASAVAARLDRIAEWDGFEGSSNGYVAWQEIRSALRDRKISDEGRQVLVARCIRGSEIKKLWTPEWHGTMFTLLQEYYYYYPDQLAVERAALDCPIQAIVSSRVANPDAWPSGVWCPLAVMVSTVWRHTLGSEVLIIDNSQNGMVVTGNTMGTTYVPIAPMAPGPHSISLTVVVGVRESDGQFHRLQHKSVEIELNVMDFPYSIASVDSEVDVSEFIVTHCGLESLASSPGPPVQPIPETMRAFRVKVPEVMQLQELIEGKADVIGKRLTVIDRSGVARMSAFLSVGPNTRWYNRDVLLLRDDEVISDFSIRIEDDRAMALLALGPRPRSAEMKNVTVVREAVRTLRPTHVLD